MTSFQDPYYLLIDAELRSTPHELRVANPATGKPFATCPIAGAPELDDAVVAARRAFPAWRDLSYAERRACISKCIETLRAHLEPLSVLLTQEQGKPIAHARSEISRACELALGIANIAMPPHTILKTVERHVEIRHVPLGVAAILTPWNAPVLLALSPLVSAIYTGNCAILKPSPFTPLTALRIGELFRTTLPRGVLAVLAGGDDLGESLTVHPGVDKISFTGSIAVGKKVLAAAAGTLKRVGLELGGNDAAIVLPDVDVNDVAKKLFIAATANSGQLCMAVKRIYAHEDIYARFCDAMAVEAIGVRLGNGLDTSSTLGPVQNLQHYRRLTALIDSARLDGHVHNGPQPPYGDGYFISPAVVTGLRDDHPLVTDEQFGPIIPILAFRDIDDVVVRANNTRFGLSGSVWSADIATATSIAERLEVGTACVNHHFFAMADAPFGGVKESGIGRLYSRIGLEAYLEPRVISVMRAQSSTS
jgi:acyl-CoA reductase-like NAD-dependent aldehyde dehydrogenase